MKTYFVFDHDARCVKIGRSNKPLTRFSELQCANHRNLDLVLVLDGDVESLMHQRFAPYRVRGEWFEVKKDLKSFLEEHDVRCGERRNIQKRRSLPRKKPQGCISCGAIWGAEPDVRLFALNSVFAVCSRCLRSLHSQLDL